MKAAIYSPYLDTFGGGEKYMMTIAEILSEENKVDVFLDEHLKRIGVDYLKNTLSKRFNLKLKGVDFISAPVGKNSSAFFRALFLKKYDVLFYLTDGSIFYPTAKKNILHIQSPLVGQPAKSKWGRFKLKGWDLIIYNSKFTQTNASGKWPLISKVVYPPVDVAKIKSLKKKPFIISVGRFFGYLKDKKHELMITAFKELFQTRQAKNWSLKLIGSLGNGDEKYLEDLRKLAKGLPVNFYPNLDYDKLIKFYGEASIYWHASGFGEDDPTKMEHFGISTVEAMAGGSVPVVPNKGGQREIVESGKSGYLWDNTAELEEFTLKLIEDNSLRKQMAGKAVEQAQNFSKEKFMKSILEILT